jgi:threonine-phosphate decarboxylase
MVKEYAHGGEYSNLEQIRLDFSVNTNPLGCPIKADDVNLENLILNYPDRECRKLKEKIAEKAGINSHNIFVGNGASEVISLLTAVLDIERALVIEPTFSGYKRALEANHIEIDTICLNEADGFEFDEKSVNDIENRFNAYKTEKFKAVLFICNPNNPTGKCIKMERIVELLEICKKFDCVLVVDESFMDFVDDGDAYSSKDYLDKYRNLFIISSFTKIYSIPGIRLGAGYGDEKLIEKMSMLQPEWSVSGIAQEYGIKLLEQEDFIVKTREYIMAERDYLITELQKMGYEVYPSHANFLLCKKEDSNVWEKLAERGILVRDCTNFTGLDKSFFRIAVKRHEENKSLIEELKLI